MLQVKKDYTLHIGVRPGDILFQYTTVCAMVYSLCSFQGEPDGLTRVIGTKDSMDYVGIPSHFP